MKNGAQVQDFLLRQLSMLKVHIFAGTSFDPAEALWAIKNGTEKTSPFLKMLYDLVNPEHKSEFTIFFMQEFGRLSAGSSFGELALWYN